MERRKHGDKILRNGQRKENDGKGKMVKKKKRQRRVKDTHKRWRGEKDREKIQGGRNIREEKRIEKSK